MKDDYATNSHYLTYTFLFERCGRMYFLSLGVKGLKVSEPGQFSCQTGELPNQQAWLEVFMPHSTVPVRSGFWVSETNSGHNIPSEKSSPNRRGKSSCQMFGPWLEACLVQSSLLEKQEEVLEQYPQVCFLVALMRWEVVQGHLPCHASRLYLPGSGMAQGLESHVDSSHRACRIPGLDREVVAHPVQNRRWVRQALCCASSCSYACVRRAVAYPVRLEAV